MAERAPFPWFGGKRDIAEVVWARLGRPRQYIEPFCGSAAVLLAAPAPAPLEVIGDANGFVANFWRATKFQPARVAEEADYPVSHIDLGGRHRWLMEHRGRLADLADPEWPGDARIAGWWLWGQCCWIGSGWCEWVGQIPHAGNAGMGGLLTSSGRAAWVWLHRLAERLERVRVVHGGWDRCLNSHYGGAETALFLDPPYRGYEEPYGATAGPPVADAVAAWAAEHSNLRIVLCGHVGDYDLPGWECERWTRKRLTYSGGETTDREALWFSPACLSLSQGRLFG